MTRRELSLAGRLERALQVPNLLLIKLLDSAKLQSLHAVADP